MNFSLTRETAKMQCIVLLHRLIWDQSVVDPFQLCGETIEKFKRKI